MKLAAALPAILAVVGASAGEADIVAVEIRCDEQSVCRFDVTVRHADAGWDHYANKWEILAPDGTLLATRELLHPHDHEQPFTRSLDNVRIPAGVDTIIVRAHDSVHAYGGQEQSVPVPQVGGVDAE